MRSTSILAAMLALAVAGTAPASAADMSPYDDPRYSDIYGQHRPQTRYAEPQYAPPPPPIYREERYAPPPPPPPHYQAPRQYGQDYSRSGCVPRQVVRDQLESRGWHDFHDPHPVGNVVHIRARRPSGRLFDLTLDRCSGQVLNMEPLDHRAAQAPPPDWYHRDRRYDRY